MFIPHSKVLLASLLGVATISATLLYPHSVVLPASPLSTLASVSGQPVSDRLAPADAIARQRINQHYGQLPLSFEINQGQSDKQVRFLSRGQGYGLFLTPTEAVLSLHKAQPDLLRPDAQLITARGKKSNDLLAASAHDKVAPVPSAVVRMSLAGANGNPEMIGLEPLPGTSNYYTGSDAKQWHTDIAHYAKVKYQDVYPGIDMIYYGTQNQLEYDLIVAPGQDPKAITLNFAGADKLSLNAHGDLLLHTAQGDVSQHKPVIYQTFQGKRHTVPGHYVLNDQQQVSFEVARYDTTQPLVIDPVLGYSTYLGGSTGDKSHAIAVDNNGNVYVTGETLSADFPIASPAQATFGGGDGIGGDAFVTKLNATGSALIYSTYLGGSGNDQGTGIAVDSSGNTYITGLAQPNFPTTSGSFQPGPNLGGSFVAKLSTTGSLSYSTYLSNAFSNGISVDSAGNAYITGATFYTGFLTTPGAFQTTAASGGNNAFVTKLNAAGSALVYSTYLGNSGSSNGIAVDSAGNAYVTGNTDDAAFPVTPGVFQGSYGSGITDAFVTKLNASGSALVYSTFLGGQGQDSGSSIAVDGLGNAYVTGDANPTFPTTPGAFEITQQLGLHAFVTKLNPTASVLIYSTFVGGGSVSSVGFNEDHGTGIAINSSGNAYITGTTLSSDFPVTADALDSTCGSDGVCNVDSHDNPASDAFFTELNSAGSTAIYSTYLGGRGGDSGAAIAVDSAGNAYLTGTTGSPDFPTLNPFQATGGSVFITKFGTVPIIGTATPTLSFSAARYAVNESQGRATIGVVRQRSAVGAVSVYYRTSNGTALARSDYTPVQGTLFWRNGDRSPKFFTIPITRDKVKEPAETVNLQLVTVYGRASLGTPRTAQLIIYDAGR